MKPTIHTVSAGVREEVADRFGNLIRQRTEVVFAYLHGSFLEGTFRDVDVAVYLDTLPPSPLAYELERETELGRLTRFPCDVRILNGAPASFRYNVVRSGRPLAVADDDARTEFVEAAIRDYCDFTPYRKRYIEETLGHGIQR
jgi:predicted nucleotidyltransferase